jgi:hypothetical protein
MNLKITSRLSTLRKRCLPLSLAAGLAVGLTAGLTLGLAASAAQALQIMPLPHSARIVYQVRMGLFTLAAQQKWQLDGKHYRVETDLELPLSLPHRLYVSQGELEFSGLQPSRYDEFQAGDPQVRHQALFDYANEELSYGTPGKLKKVPLLAGMQDLNALPFQLLWLQAQPQPQPQSAHALPKAGEMSSHALPQPLHSGFSMAVTNAKGVVQHHFEKAAAQTFTWQGKPLETVRWVSHASDGDLEIWLAPSLGDLPVVVIRSQDGKSLRFEARELSYTP